eukprot:TRINITY_DN7840_c0_g1_i1.p1 TRINITY_DN7840_c0_g1~~TRINITY_DN7840_c0_g1_i1.p1  ORF type:complete len:325 (-),score=117.64 TRINITY_DN7840_c0_g1_i1:3-977(-)
MFVLRQKTRNQIFEKFSEKIANGEPLLRDDVLQSIDWNRLSMDLHSIDPSIPHDQRTLRKTFSKIWLSEAAFLKDGIFLDLLLQHDFPEDIFPFTIDDPPCDALSHPSSHSPSHSTSHSENLWKFHRNLYVKTLEGIDVKEKSVFQFGCGRGLSSTFLLETLGMTSLTAVDTHSVHLPYLQKFSRQNLNFISEDEIPEKSLFDCVFSVGHSDVISDMLTCLNGNILKPGGWCAFTSNLNFHGKIQLENRMEKVGLEIRNVDEISREIRKGTESFQRVLESPQVLNVMSEENRQKFRRYFAEISKDQTYYRYQAVMKPSLLQIKL